MAEVRIDLGAPLDGEMHRLLAVAAAHGYGPHDVTYVHNGVYQVPDAVADAWRAGEDGTETEVDAEDSGETEEPAVDTDGDGVPDTPPKRRGRRGKQAEPPQETEMEPAQTGEEQGATPPSEE